MTVSISPVFNIPQFEDNNGVLLNGGKIYQYQAGSDSVQLATYTGIDGLVANANPVILDASGRPDTAFWLSNGTLYNLVLTDSADNVIAHYDNVSGVIYTPPSSGGGSTGVDIWNLETAVPAYVSGNQFQIPGDLSSDFAVGNRVKATCSSGLVYGTVSAVSFSSPNTQVDLIMDSTSLDSGISDVSWSSLIANGRTVDAGGVSYAGTGYGGVIGSLSYATPNTTGGQITLGVTKLAIANSRIDGLYKVWGTTGSGSNTPYAITPNPAITAYSVGEIFVVGFAAASAGSPTLNVNGLGAQPLKMFDYNGALITAVIPIGNISQVAWDGTNFIYLDQVPPVPYTAADTPHGVNTYTAPGSWTCPAGVHYVQVLCVGGGGGGGGGYWTTTGGEGGVTTIYPGGNGGGGGSAFNVVAVTPGNSYNIYIGAAGSVSGGGGGPGGVTTFGSGGGLCSATGGSGGANGTGVAAANGICSVGQFGWWSVNGNGFQIAGGTPKGTGGLGDLTGFALGSVGTAGMITIWW